MIAVDVVECMNNSASYAVLVFTLLQSERVKICCRNLVKIEDVGTVYQFLAHLAELIV